jgi:16S rRNA (cytosine967-C5)-methyltransferase
MRPGARIKAASDVLEDVIDRHRTAADALADWGRAHRFAGSSDRAAIGNLVFDALRRRLSLSSRMGADSPRALALGAAGRALALSPEAVAACADGSEHAIAPLSAEERQRLLIDPPDDLPAHIAGDIPEWLLPSFTRAFGASAALEGAGLARRAPIDLRANLLKATQAKVLKALARHKAEPARLSPVGVRIPSPAGAARAPNVEADAEHAKGWFEVQDEGSQIAALLAGARPREQVLDLCAGAGGKALALAAEMRNTGQIYAYDRDRAQLRPIFERLRRAGVRNAQVLPAGDEAALDALGPRFDLVLVDAPCTGSGVWRRRPDAKWRVRPQSLRDRQAEQRSVLGLARRLVKPGGRLVYVTCSLLPEENGDQVAWLLGEASELRLVPWRERWAAMLGTPPPVSADARDEALLLTPARHGTDGFYIATFTRVS